MSAGRTSPSAAVHSAGAECGPKVTQAVPEDMLHGYIENNY